MKITIDTKEDSPEEIQKLILLLKSLLNESSPQQEPRPVADVPLAFAAMFSGDSEPEQREQPEQETQGSPIEILTY